MYSAHFRHLFHLLRCQLILLTVVAGSAGALHAQERYLNMPNHDDKPYYFGITLAYNQAYFKLDHSSKFIHDDSVLVVEPIHSPGFNLGLLGNMRLNKRFDLRLNPTLNFAEKNLHYTLGLDSTAEDKKIESILMSFPLQVKFKSDRIGNFRFYVLGGIKAEYDLASNANARKAEDLVKLGPFDWGFEAGIGFEFYCPNFIFSPEIKISNGIGNVQVREPGNLYSNVIERLVSRMITFSIHLEG